MKLFGYLLVMLFMGDFNIIFSSPFLDFLQFNCNKKEYVKTHHVVFDGIHEDVVSDHFGLFMEDSL